MSAVTSSVWAIVLAGGDGTRLRSLTRHIAGGDCPKQFCAVDGSRTMLGQTLARIRPLIAPERTVVVGTRAHAGYLDRELRTRPPHLLLQPDNRGTGPAILWPTHWVSQRDPDAVVAVFPSDQFIQPEAKFLAHVARAVEAVRRHRDRVILLGIQPNRQEPGYGWIEPGVAVPGPQDCFRVQSFWEKPSRERAAEFLCRGLLWNSFVMVARAETITELGRRHTPEIHARLARMGAFAGSPHEEWAITQGYALMPSAGFSREILERSAELLLVMPVRGVLWSDWGTPARVVRTLRQTGLTPPWLSGWRTRTARPTAAAEVMTA
jgi:mannose-1-phosphate guanylyltransferase